MTRIVRPIGQSFTEHRDGTLQRGIRPTGSPDESIGPESLANFLQTDAFQMMRQVISALDKVYRKPSRLNSYDPLAYQRRVRLAHQLWIRLEDKFPAGLDKEARQKLRQMWLYRTFPFAEHEVDFDRPENDGNTRHMRANGNRNWPDGTPIKTEDFEGRWHGTYWSDLSESEDQCAVADLIMSHLFRQEIRISGTERGHGGSSSGKGLIEARGRSIASSTRDPARKSEQKSEQRKEALKRALGNDGLCDGYFDRDIAASIFEALMKEGRSNEKIQSAWFGDKLYEHFGEIKDRLPREENGKLTKEAWALHNAVRGFYKQLAQSEGFRRASAWVRDDGRVDEAERQKLAGILPRNKDVLLNRLGGKQKNADMSRYIQLGKRVAHASDDFENWNVVGGSSLADRVAYLSTSDGQSKIKHLESFTRSWRRATALSLRTLKALIDPEGRCRNSNGYSDLATIGPARKAYESFEDDRYRRQIPVLFGADTFGDCSPSRASLLLKGSSRQEDFEKEVQWGLNCLAAQIRHETHHFNVRRAMFAMFGNGILEETTNDTASIYNRGQRHATADAIAAFERILKFDLRLRSRRVAELLERTGAMYFVPGKEEAEHLISQLSGTSSYLCVTLPRFRGVVRKAQNLLSNPDRQGNELLERYDSVNLGTGAALTPTDRFRIDVLTELYRTGFQSWLDTARSDQDLCRNILDTMASDKQKRRTEFDKKRKRSYATPTGLLEDIGIDGDGDLDGLFERLQSRMMTERVSDRPYANNKREQRAATSRLEDFKRELFAHLFVKYLEKKGLLWLTGDLEERTESPQDVAELPKKGGEDEVPFELKPWHSQIYTWFYLVPPADMAKLQHQMRKSRALEIRSESGPDQEVVKKLEQLDELMSLYLQVQATGFNGTEHEGVLPDLDALYEDDEQFRKVFSNEVEDHDLTLSGTRRGLRQLAGYSDFDVLEGVFAQHRISEVEVRDFQTIHGAGEANGSAGNVFKEREELREKIIACVKAGPRKGDNGDETLKRKCELYAKTAHRALILRHRAEAARLGDHLRLHRILMNVLGRLTDYVAMWERDRLYAFVGMIYDEHGADAISIKPSDGQGDEEVRLCLKSASVPLVSREKGFLEVKKGNELLETLPEEMRQAFARAFDGISCQNDKDHRACKEAKADGKRTRPWPPRQPTNPEGPGVDRKQIRNDLAHYNVLTDNKGKPALPKSLTYVVNAVRSLMSYDRKMKNAVPKSIRKILAEEGLRIDWVMKGDRLKKPVVYPDVERHLGFVRPKPGTPDAQFDLPRASMRLTSMTQALFDFGTKGHDASSNGLIGGQGYPEMFYDRFQARHDLLEMDPDANSGTENE